MPHDVFLSYASADRAAADAVCAALETRGIRCWIAPRDVPAGADWGEAILTAIGRAHAMVLVLSRSTANSVHVRNEVVTAVSQSLSLVPVRIEDCQPGGALRLHLAGSHWLNVFPPPVEQHADTLAAGVRLALAADATIEIPRGQAAALVAAARASYAAAGPAAPAALMPAPAPHAGVLPTPLTATGPVTDPATPRRAAGRGVLIAMLLLVLLAALGVVAWLEGARLRAWFGAATVTPAGPADVTITEAPGPAASPPPAPDAADALPPHLMARLNEARTAPPPASPPPIGTTEAQRSLAPSASLAGLGAAIPLPPQAAAPPPVPPAARFVQAPPPVAVSPEAVPPVAPTGPAASAPPAAAPPATRLLNVASATISRLYVAPMGEGVGREDWLGNAQITPGNAVQIRAPAGQGCVFNIRAVYVGGRTEDRPGVDLCAATELRFEGGKASGAGSSR